jgi:hypothetical protein
MNPQMAQRIVESLRQGIPPNGFVCDFTVGRSSEIKHLTSLLNGGSRGAVLLKANYGAGKTHLLRFIREKALASGFAVSTVTLDAKSAIRFNRMDQILGAIFRGLEVGNSTRNRGVRSAFDLFSERLAGANESRSDHSAFWHELSSDDKWDFSDCLDSPGLYVALRAWVVGDESVKDLVQDWLHQPWNYTTQRKKLYSRLVDGLRSKFRDPRMDWQFYQDDVFSFHVNGYSQCWEILSDLETLCVAAGLRGLIILFDEFEDILTNINNVAHQQSAFWNLFQFYGSKRFNGISFFAVTPEFVHKCKARLQAKGYWDYDYSKFERIPTFQMSPLDADELEELALKIMATHGAAYGWEPDTVLKIGQLKGVVRRGASIAVEDRGRTTIRSVVKLLDELYDAQE